MTQASSAAKRAARIRCVKNAGSDSYSWSGKEKRTEKYLPMSHVQALEEAFAKKRAKVSRTPVTFDLKNMKMKKKGCDDIDLQRVSCEGKPYDAKHKPVSGLKPAASANGGNTTPAGKDDGSAKKDSAPAAKGKRKVDADSDAAASSAGDSGSEMKTVLLKGRAPVDSQCPVAARFHVYCEGDDIWDCMLNQTNIQSNNNKYYLIQLLESDDGHSFSVWMRWGRVGYGGQNSLTEAHGNLDSAKSVFTWKFQEKTRNAWCNRHAFKKVPGKYDLLKMDYGEDEPDAKKIRTEAAKAKKEIEPCKLEKRVQDLIELICNVKVMEDAVVEMQYDAKKGPLGKLTEDQIKAGYEALKRIDELISAKKTGAELEKACSAFYTRIPHNFGMRPPTLIRTAEEVRLKLDLLEALGDIQLALKLMSEEEESGTRSHPTDNHYRALDCEITHLAPSHPHRKLISKYLATTHGATHCHYKLKLLDAYAVNKPSEGPRFRDVGHRMLLWHGSRMSNWAGILGAGLKIAPPEAPSTGYMFGKGIYFADMASKSANYCRTTRQNNRGILLLSEVSLGKCNEKVQADYRGDKLPAGKHSVKGLGTEAPAPKTFVTMEDGVVVPIGPARPVPGNNCLQYNEYIVYNVAQVRMRYVLLVQFEY
ncbi:poly [ADP-ribose] polymerase 2-like [Pollicipes pollicipes]|uniref:poly [ADP-ribose] polymerase 2-like n=1 Tax=Pollicipes pollicipes TaxID=41117 RepID=UPI00188564F8|nr:poly [ADP-ribose] polymerase 2-like [Pollicipes pollicipes]